MKRETPKVMLSSKALLRAIADAESEYDRRYRELIDDGEAQAQKERERAVASWLTLLHGVRTVT